MLHVVFLSTENKSSAEMSSLDSTRWQYTRLSTKERTTRAQCRNVKYSSGSNQKRHNGRQAGKQASRQAGRQTGRQAGPDDMMKYIMKGSAVVHELPPSTLN